MQKFNDGCMRYLNVLNKLEIISDERAVSMFSIEQELRGKLPKGNYIQKT